ncbi:MAG: ComF family protein [Bacteroidota bacterium]|nr:ComF family protein [Bacteroidota bacterium]
MSIQSLREKIFYGIDAFLDIIYPTICISCERKTNSIEELFCLNCQYELQVSDMYQFTQNAFTEKFKGRIELNVGAAMYPYVKGGVIQKVLEALKYKNRPDIGHRLGKHFGKILSQEDMLVDLDLIIPVPLHYKKKVLRGYNQSMVFGVGLAEHLHTTCREDVLQKTTWTDSQVEKNRMDRMQNMDGAFKLKDAATLKGKHILLVDDILTTGATLESCALTLLKAGGVRISMLTIAMGS